MNIRFCFVMQSIAYLESKAVCYILIKYNKGLLMINTLYIRHPFYLKINVALIKADPMSRTKHS